MPYVFDFEQQDWNEDQPPPADQFQYLPPPALDGRKSPVSFKADAGGLTITGPEPGASAPAKGIRARLFGGGSKPSVPERRDFGPFLELLMPHLLELGMAKATCRYDGGNDEGFAWLDGIELRDGRKLTFAQAAKAVGGTGLGEALVEASVKMRNPNFNYATTEASDLVQASLRDELPSMFAEILLGQGYGTGNYSMYGTFVVDFDKGTITDDPAAPVVVENIEIAGKR